ncbi:hypothetical protein GJ496_011517 [Pomphorhynchus laevis]|nr:hypothetical protein GJ496_011517 [Pomphorhynchus laevis]
MRSLRDSFISGIHLTVINQRLLEKQSLISQKAIDIVKSLESDLHSRSMATYHLCAGAPFSIRETTIYVKIKGRRLAAIIDSAKSNPLVRHENDCETTVYIRYLAICPNQSNNAQRDQYRSEIEFEHVISDNDKTTSVKDSEDEDNVIVKNGRNYSDNSDNI